MDGVVLQSMQLFGIACRHTFFGLPSWYEYLNLDPANCTVVRFQVPGDLALVGLALVDILLHVAGLAAVVFVIYGGIQYTTSQGNPDAAAKAQNTIVNALIGLALSTVAIAFVSFLGRRLT
jgi:hypothetical protein